MRRLVLRIRSRRCQLYFHFFQFHDEGVNLIEALAHASPAPQVQEGDLITHLHGARRAELHHATAYGDTANGAWRDAGLIMMERSDRSNPTLVTHWNWPPPLGGGTYNCLPLPDEADYISKGGNAVQTIHMKTSRTGW